MSETIKMRDGDTMLIMVKDGEVIHFTPNMGLPHSEFVKRTTGQLPAGAWAGTVSKLDGEVAAITLEASWCRHCPSIGGGKAGGVGWTPRL